MQGHATRTSIDACRIHALFLQRHARQQTAGEDGGRPGIEIDSAMASKRPACILLRKGVDEALLVHNDHFQT